MFNVYFSCMLNGGYIVKIILNDPHFNTISQFIEADYFRLARNTPIKIRFQLLASADGGEFPYTATKEQIAYVTSIQTYGTNADVAHVEFIAIDPASYLLNKGDGSGTSYQGKVSNVIKQVVKKYAPDIQLSVSETIDSDKNRFWMMRQTPQGFINSLLDWSSSVTRGKTNWIVAPAGHELWIKEQADIKPMERAYYTFWEPTTVVHDTIMGWQMLTDNSLSISHNKIITQGLSAVSGSYYDRVSDQKEQNTVAKDATTPNKITATSTVDNSYTKPPADTIRGVTSVPAIPEIYSAGELGLKYPEYIDGTARDLWLNVTRRLIRCKFKVLGHGEWSDGLGLGSDTIKVLWTQAEKGSSDIADAASAKKYFMSGNWLVYGFEHDLNPSRWETYVHTARFDWDAISTKFPAS